MDLTLPRPEGLDHRAWEAIWAHRERLNTALTGRDRSLIVGCAKELVESIARVVVEARGDTAPANINFEALIGRAHIALERQPGPDLSSNPNLRAIAQGLRTIAAQLGDIRNTYGTGHGRTADPQIEAELSDVAVEAALLWSRWALRRTDDLILGNLVPLLDQVRGPGTFSQGQLTRRLQAVNLPALEEADQRRLGTTIGRRAASGTFNVRIEGVDACIDSGDVQTWPTPYRVGVAIGLLLDWDGVLQLIDGMPLRAAQVIAPVADLDGALEAVWTAVGEAPIPASLRNQPAAARAAAATLDDAAGVLPAAQRATWRRLAARLATT